MKSIFLQTALIAAKESSVLLRTAFTKKITTSNKNTNISADWVTKYDLLSQKKISNVISEKFPHHDLLGEENLKQNNGSEYRWIIDPIDGTSNFSHGIPYFSISIALTHKEETIVGCIALPLEEKIIWAEKDRGAFCNGKAINVSTTNNLSNSLIGLGLIRNPEGYRDYQKTIKYFAEEKIKFRTFGSIATDLTRVSQGQLDACIIHRANLWDVAAGLLIVKEAGGTVIQKNTSILAGGQIVSKLSL